MLFKRLFEGKPMLKLTPEAKALLDKKCLRRKSQCFGGCWEHSTIIEETLKMALLGLVLWLGLSLGSHGAPYPLSLLIPNDIIHPLPMYDFPFPTAEMLRRLPHVTSAHTNRSIDISKLTVSMLKRLEDNLQNAGVAPKHGSSAQGLLIDGYPTKEAMHYGKSSMIITKASQNLVVTQCMRYGLPTEECASFISTLNLRDSEFRQECAVLERFSCRTPNARYRTFDGSCNNPVRSAWGQALTGYKRLLHPRYSDGIEEPRLATNNHALPSARFISTEIANNVDKPDGSKTMALAVWSQFVFHDLTHTPVRKTIHEEQPIRCCGNSGYNLAPRYIHPSCMPISVPTNDPFFGKKDVACLEYTRSVTTYRGDCTFGAAEQMNQATHFLDGSHIYGTNSRQAALLRQSTGGLMKTEILNDEEFPPMSANPKEKCMIQGDDEICFQTGDVRSNMNPWLGGMHTLWIREHNRIARALAVLNPSWKSERLYHEARHIVIAQLQHITYKHWLPTVTGKAYDEIYESYDIGYNSEINPTVTNSFATAASHFITSLLDEDIELFDDKGNVSSSHRLVNKYYNPGMIAQNGSFDMLLRGMISQKSQGMDFNYDSDIWNSYLGGGDALALAVQRGRDHGLPAYTQFRILCHLSQVTAFHHLTDTMKQETVDKLSSIYDRVEDIDLVVGGMAELPVSGSMLGPTFTCLLKEQLFRTRVGDRFWYSHVQESGSLSAIQLSEIRRTTLARVLCDNTDVGRLQRDVMKAPSQSNPILSCDEIKKVNLEEWQDAAQKPDIITRTQQNVKKWIKNRVTK